MNLIATYYQDRNPLVAVISQQPLSKYVFKSLYRGPKGSNRGRRIAGAETPELLGFKHSRRFRSCEHVKILRYDSSRNRPDLVQKQQGRQKFYSLVPNFFGRSHRRGQATRPRSFTEKRVYSSTQEKSLTLKNGYFGAKIAIFVQK